MKLNLAAKRFVLHWGEMGARWGINRTVAQVHALLYLSPKPLHAEEIAEALDVTRSHVGNAVRELQGWGVVKVVHVMGERREYYESLKDAWEMFRVILDERKKRETDPTLAVLRELTAEAKAGGKSEAVTHERLAAMLDFFETMTSCYTQMGKMPTATMIQFARNADAIVNMLGGAAGA